MFIINCFTLVQDSDIAIKFPYPFDDNFWTFFCNSQLQIKILTGKTHSQIKLKRLRNVWIWCIFGQLVHQINYLEEILILKLNFQKNEVVSGKSPFFVIGPFCTPHSICLNIGFWQVSSVCENVALSFIVLWTKKHYSRFLRKDLSFLKTLLKTFKIASDCHVKTYRSLKRRAILKIHRTIF